MTRHDKEALRDQLAPQCKRLSEVIEAVATLVDDFPEAFDRETMRPTLRRLVEARSHLRGIANLLEDDLGQID